MPDQLLSYDKLHERHYAITPETAAEWAQTTRICLFRHHLPPVSIFEIMDQGAVQEGTVAWRSPDVRERHAWIDRSSEATDRSACAIALSALELTRGLVAMSSAIKGNGADYLLDDYSEDLFDFYVSGGRNLEAAFRLEIRGVDRGGDATLLTALKQKIRQLVEGDSNLPAVAVVVGFQALKVFVSDVVPG